MPGAKREQILALDPPNELVFNGDFTVRVCRTTLTLGNPTEGNLAYKVKTTAPRRYCVRPNSGRIAPGESAKVNIMLQPSQNNDDLTKHKFMVQSVECAAEQLETPVDDLFRSLPSSEVMSKKLYCQFNNQATEDGTPDDAGQDTKESDLPEYSAIDESTTERVTAVETAVAASADVIKRPQISAVPEEPKLVNPEAATPAPVISRPVPVPVAAPAQQLDEGIRRPEPVKREVQAAPQPRVVAAPKAENASEKAALLSRIKELESSNASLNSKITLGAGPGPIQPVEDPSTVRKVMMIIGVCSLIMGYFIGTFFCKSC